MDKKEKTIIQMQFFYESKIIINICNYNVKHLINLNIKLYCINYLTKKKKNVKNAKHVH